MIMSKTKKNIILLDLSLILTIFALGPVTGLMSQLLPACYVTALGLQCPACGGTRCIRALAAGDLPAAFHWNPYIFLTVCFLGALLVLLNMACLFQSRLSRRLLRHISPGITAIVWAAGFVIFGILRNFF